MARIAKKHLSACIVLGLPFLMSAVIAYSQYHNGFDVSEASRNDVRLEARAARDIREILDYIGHGVTIREIEAGWSDEPWAAAYWSDRKISIDAQFMFTDDLLLFVMAHECVHALFRQRNLLEESPPILEYQGLVHETAASVMGAHIAGAITSRRGGDGKNFTEQLLKGFRMSSHGYISGEMRKMIADLQISTIKSSNGAKFIYWPGTYFGTESLIDVINPICREHPEPFEAAHIIATTLHNVDEKTARKFPIPRDWRPKRRN